MHVGWAPWRMTYIEGPRPEACIFCVDKGASRDLVLAEDAAMVVMLNMYPYNNGHLMVAPREHVARLGDISREKYVALMDGLLGTIEIIEQVFKPQGMNVGINIGAPAGAGIEDHLHWHVVPRWDGDTNYMPVIAEVKVLPQHLQDTHHRLLPHFDGWMAERRR